MLKKEINLIVASTNPVKVAAAVEGFRQLFPELDVTALPLSVASEVADQPMTDAETLQGALNRVANAALAKPEADYWIGLEGGVAPLGEELAAFAWIVVRSKTGLGKARTGTFFLPPAVSELVLQGIELGTADDMIFGSKNSKQAGGAIGLLSQNAITRKQLYQQAVVLALLPFKNPALYKTHRQPG
ncbi:inosine/xanthosine triphosphatase [Cesiribacter andamanensis]|uniref:Probable inosine/xanthosine triphosphatase n=1 Tax=Cesiribacter andamanensis AMV16 TaxID=1279009 RepID=M7NQU0_9BACT|nr:inosine/xanthosine triphosphatase [Cesiribacter andamanensis]EMR04085.1 Non-canonical purine NTP phosphatase [Cesiribacter andamanensis AMV16]